MPSILFTRLSLQRIFGFACVLANGNMNDGSLVASLRAAPLPAHTEALASKQHATLLLISTDNAMSPSANLDYVSDKRAAMRPMYIIFLSSIDGIRWVRRLAALGRHSIPAVHAAAVLPLPEQAEVHTGHAAAEAGTASCSGPALARLAQQVDTAHTGIEQEGRLEGHRAGHWKDRLRRAALGCTPAVEVVAEGK